MNNLLWMFAIVLAVIFLVTGALKVFFYNSAAKRFQWVADLPRPLIMALGIVEILGALGLILPAATRVYPLLTPVAAIALALLMLSASTFHMARHETEDMSVNMLLFLMAGFVAIGRLMLAPLG